MKLYKNYIISTIIISFIAILLTGCELFTTEEDTEDTMLPSSKNTLSEITAKQKDKAEGDQKSTIAVQLDNTTLSLNVRNTETLQATVSPSTATNKTVRWTSSDTSIATVNANGKVTALKNGRATITATTEDGSNKTATCTVTVKTPVASVNLNQNTLSLNVRHTETLQATVLPSTATNKTVRWTSSDTSIATVNANGKVTALKNGRATITATTADGGKTARCTVYTHTVMHTIDLSKFKTENITGDQNGLRITDYTGKEKNLILPPIINGKEIFEIGDNAFYNKKLTSITIPDSVTTIGKQAFSENKLTSLTIGNSVTTIGDYAFYQNQLTSFTIPDSVTTIGMGAFKNNQLTSLTIGNSVTTIKHAAFNENKLTSLTIPDSVTTIGDYAFLDNQLTSLTIPDSVTTIWAGAFQNNQLTSLTIGNSVTTIGIGAFENNKDLKEVIVRNSNSSSLTKIERNRLNSTFSITPLKDGDPTTTVTITVPRGLKSNYQKLWAGKIDNDNGITWQEQ